MREKILDLLLGFTLFCIEWTILLLLTSKETAES
ncbi:hypothetical protein METH109765_00025 [Mesobacillus thioparans]